jgi:hypothetical protein
MIHSKRMPDGWAVAMDGVPMDSRRYSLDEIQAAVDDEWQAYEQDLAAADALARTDEARRNAAPVDAAQRSAPGGPLEQLESAIQAIAHAIPTDPVAEAEMDARIAERDASAKRRPLPTRGDRDCECDCHQVKAVAAIQDEDERDAEIAEAEKRGAERDRERIRAGLALRAYSLVGHPGDWFRSDDVLALLDEGSGEK